ncbi:MAG: 4Fe-4S dicluster domain-containing protein, partial [Candidatus Omnitrophota bacterium]
MGVKKLFLDLEVLNSSPKCEHRCSYFYHQSNNGIATLREYATYLIVCRKCEYGTCVRSCPKDALEKEKDKPLIRHTFRCVSCKSCSFACPFGTIYPDILPYITSTCDYCINRLKDNEVPLCVRTCSCGALKYGEFKEEP